MRVSPERPFKVVYSLFSHEYLGVLFESFVVQLDENGGYSLAYQNVSSKNASEFAGGLEEDDYELIKLIDSMEQGEIVKKFNLKNMKPKDFLRKIYGSETPTNADNEIKRQIDNRLEIKRAKILSRIQGKSMFEMANDGNPTWKEISIMPQPASVLFHFRRNEDNTHYFPTIKYGGEKLDWQYKGGYLICYDPAWLVVENKLYSFEKNIDGKKLLPFLNKKFIVVPKKVEKSYYERFVKQLIASFDVYAKGFDIKVERHAPVAVLGIGRLQSNSTLDIFGDNHESEGGEQIVFDLKFQYGDYFFRADQKAAANVELKQEGDHYTFYKVIRDLEKEKYYGKLLNELGLPIRSSRASLEKTQAFDWIATNIKFLDEEGIQMSQRFSEQDKKYFVGQSSITIDIRENIDWFDVKAIVKFGSFEIPFLKIRQMLVKGKSEFELPNGEIAVIPSSWFINYSDIFSFVEEENTSKNKVILKKHHVALANELQKANLVRLTLSEKLNKLRDFSTIDSYSVPKLFKGKLRPYQKAGYDWLRFLNEYNFGGCLADDMGLGKTIQALALLAYVKEQTGGATSLLIMPTSLIYNWELEAKKFVPDLKVLLYTGPTRNKDSVDFSGYDLVFTSYGITRLDVDILAKFHFHYILLDESQAIKNPASIISKAVNTLSGQHRLILTGTPVENSTMDLWSQMNFINPGLLGGQHMFNKQFLQPIEKKQSGHKAAKLHALIKPFVLRRLKSQVATDLPEKVTQVKYSTMTEEQEKIYENVKNYYREKIVNGIQVLGANNQQFTLLRGLTQLRQLANHPKLTDSAYDAGSGKLEDIVHMIRSTVSEGHKVLVFSQFVKHLAIVKEFLEEEKIRFSYLDGSTRDRQSQVESFQQDPAIKVFLISLKAGGVGLNLTAAEYVFLLDPWWNPAVESQAIDRAHRIGQQKKVFTYKFITRNTVEEKIMALQARKTALADGLIGKEESFIKSLSKEDISALLN